MLQRCLHRYDGLVGMFSGKDVPAVGVSFGIERMFNILEEQALERAQAAGHKLRESETQVLVGSIGKNLQPRRLEICQRPLGCWHRSRVWLQGQPCPQGAVELRGRAGHPPDALLRR